MAHLDKEFVLAILGDSLSKDAVHTHVLLYELLLHGSLNVLQLPLFSCGHVTVYLQAAGLSTNTETYDLPDDYTRSTTALKCYMHT